MKRKIFLCGVPAAAILALAAALCWPSGYMVSRDIGCANADSPREREICGAIAGSMEWTWFGHAIISPGWRPTWDSARAVYCGQKISEADLPALESLRRVAADWRLESGVDYQARLIRNRDGKGGEPENSIFNPKNPQYILKGGCR